MCTGASIHFDQAKNNSWCDDTLECYQLDERHIAADCNIFVYYGKKKCLHQNTFLRERAARVYSHHWQNGPITYGI